VGSNSFYITTAIYYPTAAPHVGSAFEIIGTDALARYQRLRGRDVRFLTGMDEHAERVLDTARARGQSPQDYVNAIAEQFRQTWGALHISNDGFIQTTEPRHVEIVSTIFKRLLDQGDIYAADYHGLYCVKCESFLAESQVKDGLCPECGRPTKPLSEPAFFFRLSKYQKALEDYFASHPGFILPEFRQREMVNSFLVPGLVDMCISRKTLDWGVPLPGAAGGVIYVWFDALINYLTGCGYLQDEAMFRRYWPADVHVIGKDIPRFHTILWPAMLMALDLSLPKRIFIHGFIGMDGTKMSKSAGNVADPRELSSQFTSDGLRYFLLREVNFGGDGAFSVQRLAERYNFDLGNDLGNLLNRAVTMIDRYLGGAVPSAPAATDAEAELIATAEGLFGRVDPLMDELQFSRAIEAIWELVRGANKYAEHSEPWKLAKDPAARGRLECVLYCLAESLRIVSVWLSPFMPQTTVEIRRQLGLGEAPGALPDSVRWGQFPAGTKVVKGPTLFPKVELPR
jgi:methionyl-tRNA synthetase